MQESNYAGGFSTKVHNDIHGHEVRECCWPPILQRGPQYPFAYVRQRRCWLGRPQSKGTSGIRVIGLSLPYFIREPAYYDGRGLTSLDAGAKGTHGKQDHGVTSRGTRCRHGARPTPMGDDWRRHRIKGGHPRQSRTTRRTSSPTKISTSVEEHVKREIRSCQMQV